MLRGQYPCIEFIASGGVSLENCAEYIHAGAAAVGVGAAIADSASISRGEFRIFKERAKRFRKAITEAQARWRSGEKQFWGYLFRRYNRILDSPYNLEGLFPWTKKSAHAL